MAVPWRIRGWRGFDDCAVLLTTYPGLEEEEGTWEGARGGREARVCPMPDREIVRDTCMVGMTSTVDRVTMIAETYG